MMVENISHYRVSVTHIASTALPLGILIVVAFFVLIAVIASRHGRRTRVLAALAPTIGFRFEGAEWVDPSQVTRLQALFPSRAGRRFRNIMTGTSSGLSTCLFDHDVIDDDLPITFAAFFHSLQLPAFQFMHNNAVLSGMVKITGIRRRLMTNVLTFDSHPDFSSKYLVLADADDQGEVRELFTPAVLSYLETLPRNEMWRIQGDGPILVIHRQRLVRVRDIKSFLERTSFIAHTFLDSCGVKRTA